MLIKMVRPLAGMIEGVSLPQVGGTVDLPEANARSLVDGKYAEVVKADKPAKDEPAPAVAPETASVEAPEKRGPGRPKAADKE